MARKALTDEQKYKYIADNAEVFVERNKKNADKLNGFEKLEGEALHKLYMTVKGSVRRANIKSNNMKIVNDSPFQVINNVLSGYISKNDIDYTEWKEIKELLEEYILAIEGKMKDAAMTELKNKKAELEILRNTITELEAKINQ